jgi:hypothetical protein
MSYSAVGFGYAMPWLRWQRNPHHDKKQCRSPSKGKHIHQQKEHACLPSRYTGNSRVLQVLQIGITQA